MHRSPILTPRRLPRFVLQNVLKVVLIAFGLFWMTATQSGASAGEATRISATTDSGEHHWAIELAADDKTRQVGLMNRKSMPEMTGMLFDFHRDMMVMMWMKNTFIPLDMIFIDRNGTIIRIANNTVPHSTDIISSGQPVRYVLEINAGEAAKTGLKPGLSMHHPLFGGE
ncbi:MAG: DUF192 domain-containing protein [Pseudomonadota bacterium]